MSLTIANLIVLVIASLLKLLKVEISHEALLTTVLTLAQLISAIGVWYGRYRHGDVTWYGKLKK